MKEIFQINATNARKNLFLLIDQVVKNTAGSIKTSGYKADELELAKKEFTKRYKKSKNIDI